MTRETREDREEVHSAARPGLEGEVFVQRCARCGAVLVPDLGIAQAFPVGEPVASVSGACWRTTRPASCRRPMGLAQEGNPQGRRGAR